MLGVSSDTRLLMQFARPGGGTHEGGTAALSYGALTGKGYLHAHLAEGSGWFYCVQDHRVSLETRETGDSALLEVYAALSFLRLDSFCLCDEVSSLHRDVLPISIPVQKSAFPKAKPRTSERADAEVFTTTIRLFWPQLGPMGWICKLK
jgi:hypothetical protein